MLRLVKLKKVVDTDAVITIQGYIDEELAQMNRLVTIKKDDSVDDYIVISINDLLRNDVLEVVREDEVSKEETPKAQVATKKVRTKKEN